MGVALLDLTRQFSSVADDVRQRVNQVLEAQNFILGGPVRELEEAVSEYLGVEHAIGVASGTDALLLVLRSLDLAAGDEVITSPFTFFATAGAIHNAGGRPVFVDIDPDTFNIDAGQVERAISLRTRAIVPVHLFGQMAAVEPLREIADRHGLFLFEDAAQAIGARRMVDGESAAVGRVGDAAALSFFPSKNLGGAGDGGMIVTRHAELADRLRRLRVHGGVKMYHHDEVGFNSRLDTLQAAVLLAKLPHLDSWSEGRRRNAAWYSERLAHLEKDGHLRRPHIEPVNQSVYNQYTVRVRDRDALREHLSGQGIGTAVYYPVPLHLQPCFAYLGYGAGDFPEAERAAAEVLSIPIYPELTMAEREEVARGIESYFAS
jgi:dTDP-4-amino-4,6-dideoxygalactose transaminase